MNDFEVAQLRGVRIARIHELQYLALGDAVGRVRHDFNHAL